MTYRDDIQDDKRALASELLARGIPEARVEGVIASGYRLFPFPVMQSQGTPFQQGKWVADGFYGTKTPSGLVPLDWFANYLQGNLKPTKPHVRRFTIKSLAEAVELLNSGLGRNQQAGVLTFRGQTREYKVCRPEPNPVQGVADGSERLIIPAYWRNFHEDWDAREDPRQDPLKSIRWDHLVYYGMPNWETLANRNWTRYGPHSLSELEEFPDEESREYGRRWRIHKVESIGLSDALLLQQHYGIETVGLDLTFDLATALFFASHKFEERPNGRATFQPVAAGTRAGLVYAFRFHDPPVTRSADLVERFHLFEHIPPVRPLRQKCAIRRFDAFGFNEAPTDLDFILELDHDFVLDGLPSPAELFPPPAEDPFYAALLDLKAKLPQEFGTIPEYEFG